MKRLLLILLCLPFLAAPVRALEVKETRWGFDGRVVPGRFNILSIRVAQPGGQPFDGELMLRETRGPGSSVGAPLVQPLYLTPGTERWIQFTPFHESDMEAAWTIEWGRGPAESMAVEPGKFGAPSTVLLIDSASAIAGENRLKTFPSELFPPTVAATDGLDAVVLDHVPRWEAPRREAFLDWLKRGGIVHLLRTASGFPVFDGDLAPLNATKPRARIGAGLVVRHEATRAECSEEFLARSGYPPRELQPGKENRYFGFNQAVLHGLIGLTRPDIAWWLIYLLTLAYLVIAGPLHFYWSKRYDYRVSLGILLSTIVAFTLAFILAGRRGGGESQTVRSVSIARTLGDRRFDVMQWGNAFATSSGYYKLTHPAPANLYSMTNDYESVRGRIFNGRDGHFDVDLPLYSSRPFLHRAAMVGDDISLQVTEWGESRVVLQPGKDFPKSATEIWARSAAGLLQFENRDGAWVWDVKTHPPRTEQDVFTPEKLLILNSMQYQGMVPEKGETFLLLMANARGGVEGMPNRIIPRALSGDRLELFIFADMPAGFHLQGKGFGHEQGWVLYVQEISQPATP